MQCYGAQENSLGSIMAKVENSLITDLETGLYHYGLGKELCIFKILFPHPY